MKNIYKQFSCYKAIVFAKKTESFKFTDDLKEILSAI